VPGQLANLLVADHMSLYCSRSCGLCTPTLALTQLWDAPEGYDFGTGSAGYHPQLPKAPTSHAWGAVHKAGDELHSKYKRLSPTANGEASAGTQNKIVADGTIEFRPATFQVDGSTKNDQPKSTTSTPSSRDELTLAHVKARVNPVVLREQKLCYDRPWISDIALQACLDAAARGFSMSINLVRFYHETYQSSCACMTFGK
jgi:hypothetical protein